jgi:TrmH family RNA methyltransferase
LISRSHKAARRLRDLRRDPSLRAAEGVFVAEGRHVALEALASGVSIEMAVVSPRLRTTAEGAAIETRLQAAGVEMHETSDAILDALQDAKTAQPVVIVVRQQARAPATVMKAAGGVPFVAVACGIQDPGNLGSIMRTAEAAGATGFAAAAGGADVFHPRTVRATMGAIFRIPVAHAPLLAIVQAARDAGLRLVGADAQAATSYEDFDWTQPVALLLGAEGAGLPGDARAHLDARVAIPMAAGVESLSVAAAAAVVMFEAARARRRSSRGG